MDSVLYKKIKKLITETLEGAGALKGQKGDPGRDATINGVNALNLVAGENVKLKQTGDDLELSVTGGGSVVGGVESFNGRNGAVISQDGDYTAEMVGADPAGSAAAAQAAAIAAAAEDTAAKANAAEAAAKAASRPADWMPTAEDVGALPNSTTAADIPYSGTGLSSTTVAGALNELAAGGGTQSGVVTFNGRSGAVTPQAGDYTASDVGARPSDWMPTAEDVGALPEDTAIPSKTSELENDSGFVTADDVPAKTSQLENDSGFLAEETDPTVHDWAKAENKPEYSAAEISFDNNGTSLDATTVQEALAEAAQMGGGVSTAAEVSYDDTETALDAANVQEAIEALAERRSGDLDDRYVRADGGGRLEFGAEFGDGPHTVLFEEGDDGLRNPNLLDNWYFKSPINQRGVSGTISEVGYFIDRWLLTSGTVQLTAAGLVLNGTIEQRIETAPDGNVTVTALTDTGLVTGTYETVSGQAYQAVVTVTGIGQTFIAAKAELGDSQTLAHQDAGGWVLNDLPPKKGEELAECQRFYYMRVGPWIYGKKLTGADNTVLNVGFPTTMRVTPSVNLLIGNNIDKFENIEPAQGGIHAYKNGDIATVLGIYKLEAIADL